MGTSESVPGPGPGRRQLVSFTVPNPVSSSLRRRMDEETGTALAGAAAAAEFGAIIKLSLPPSSLAAPGPFPVWATILIVIVCSVPCFLGSLVEETPHRKGRAGRKGGDGRRRGDGIILYPFYLSIRYYPYNTLRVNIPFLYNVISHIIIIIIHIHSK